MYLSIYISKICIFYIFFTFFTDYMIKYDMIGYCNMCSSKYITRSLTEIPLIGQPIAELKCSTLPTNGEVLKYFFYIKNNSQHYSQLQG